MLIFGAKKLPEAARGLGRSMRILKSEVSAMHEDDAVRKGDAPDAAAGANPTALRRHRDSDGDGPGDAPRSRLRSRCGDPVCHAPVAAPAPAPCSGHPCCPAPACRTPAVVQATTIDGKPAVIINGVPTLIDNRLT